MSTPSEHEILSLPATRANLARWGVPWPPRRGWRKKLLKTARHGADRVASGAPHVCTIEFDGGSSCNIPSRGYGEGYGSYQINDRDIVRVSFGLGHSSNSAEIRTLVRALEDLLDTDPVAPFKTVLIRGDSQIALKWVLHRGPIKGTPSPQFVEAVGMLQRTADKFTLLRTEWRGREHSVALFGH